MARIRTVKPELLRHVDLFEAERETGLPLRIAFVGMLTAADRQGRFKWEPRALKLDCLPYDDVDFSRVLDALWSRGWLVRYRQTTETGGHEYGLIPTFLQHQHINNREHQSVLPGLDDTCVEVIEYEADQDTWGTRASPVTDASPTRQPRVPDAIRGEGKGREGEEAGLRPNKNSDSQYGNRTRTQPLVIEKIATSSLKHVNSLDVQAARNGAVSVRATVPAIDVAAVTDAIDGEEGDLGRALVSETIQ